jgi:Arc/MetJ-type ribon-helix-helix transcriptional regulator
VAKKTGRPLSEDAKQETRSVTVPDELWDEVRELADANNASVSSVVRGALRWLVGQDKDEKK